MAASRLPGKPLLDIAGQPLIAHVVARANESNAHRVIVATDDMQIAAALEDSDCEVCMTRADHLSGSDRLAEVVEKLEIEGQQLIVNVQGDEPAIPARLIDEVAASLEKAPQAAMSTAAHRIKSIEDFNNPNVVKVVVDQTDRALYFSRAAIPFTKDGSFDNAWHHVGIYAYRAEFLKRYTKLQASDIEQGESLEQLRVMDNGETIMVQKIDYDAGVGVDTPEDLKRVRALFNDAANTLV